MHDVGKIGIPDDILLKPGPLTPAEWDRAGTHSESGAYSVDKWLQIYAVHAHNHADQIRRARATLCGRWSG